jgi:DNA recombination protein RmuC
MPTPILLVIGFVFGLSISAFAGWALANRAVRSAREQVKSQMDIEVVRVAERLVAATNERDYVQKLLAESDAETTTLQEQVEKLREERAHLDERANRVPGIEQALEQARQDNDQIKFEFGDVREKLGAADANVNVQKERIAQLEGHLHDATNRQESLLAEQEQLKGQLAHLTTLIEAERQQALEKAALLTDAKEQFAATFKVLANEILQDNANRLTEENKNNIGQILDPLKEKIREFRARIDQVHDQETIERTALAAQVEQLHSLNQQLSQDASNLTQALKGSNKVMGNWGEMILERMLENSGLRKDSEYLIRPTHEREDRTKAQPDAVIFLPENRQLVVDAKVSLIAYEEYTCAESEAERAGALERHIDSFRTHIDELSSRNYQSLDAIKTLDFVIMFVPIESAFMIALPNDSPLWEEAWRKNILLVSPGMFLFVVRTVANLWRQEQQNRNVQEIAKCGADMYDKLVSFVEELSKVGERLGQAKDSYDSAYSKLHTGRGNLIRRAETLRDLGVKPTKSLPLELVENAQEAPPAVEKAAAQAAGK